MTAPKKSTVKGVARGIGVFGPHTLPTKQAHALAEGVRQAGGAAKVRRVREPSEVTTTRRKTKRR